MRILLLALGKCALVVRIGVLYNMVTTLSKSAETCKTSLLSSPSGDELRDMQAAYSASCVAYESKAEKTLSKTGTIIVSGIGCSLRVKNDALVVFPGKTHAQQKQETRTLYRGVHGCDQIIVLSEKGIISLDAMAWARAQGISIIMLDGHGNLVESCGFAGEKSNAILRRKQYGAKGDGMEGRICSELVRRKVGAQLETLKRHPELSDCAHACDVLRDALKWFDLRELPERYYDANWLRTLEGRCADIYFSAWRGMPVKWEKNAGKSVPPHWHVVGYRSSPLSHHHGARHAVDPANACLNYGYAILESACRQALKAYGFDVTCGFLHADVAGRDSLVYDLMELHRAEVDDLVLRFLGKHVFGKGDMMGTRDGTVKFNPQLARYLAASCRLQQADVDESAKWLKGVLMGN